MQYVVTADEMREYDNNTIEKIGIPALVLMERAALAVRDVIKESCSKGSLILIVTGMGNNGADGLALARLLAEEGYGVDVCPIGDRERASQQYKQQLAILKHYPVEIWDDKIIMRLLQRLKECPKVFDVVVDAVFGVGLSREISGDYAEAIAAMNALQGRKVAVDIPSGICADSGKVLGVAFRADITVTFGFGKRGLYFYPGTDYTGQLRVADIGISERAFCGREPGMFVENGTLLKALPKRRSDGNKGTFGKVLIIAGFEHMIGAAILSARAALEMGAGMVKVLCPLENRAILQTAAPEVLYGTCEELESSIKWADVAVIGPGLGKSAEAEKILTQLLKEADLPLILDADALNMMSVSEELKQLLKAYKADKILTPHVGELARLYGTDIFHIKEHFIEVAKELAKEYHGIMVCKDARTLVASMGNKLFLNTSGNSGMATAGSGDVLTGIIGALYAQNAGQLDSFMIAVTGVYLHGLAGDAARDAYTEYGVTAGRLVDNIKNIPKKE